MVYKLEAIVNHVVLPPQLPGKSDGRVDEIEHALANRLLDASRTLRDLNDGQVGHQWNWVRLALQKCMAINAGGRLERTSLLGAFQRLEQQDTLILHVSAQNAGLLMTRRFELGQDVVVFEAFEASPASEQVLAAEAALQWDFPGCVVALPYEEFAKPSFQHQLATFLEQASRESIKRFAARTHKAGSSAFESRDTVDPALISHLLMTLLEVNGRRIFPPRLRKRVRDDVCWTDGSEKPWRRCAFWLVLRVAVQRFLQTLHGHEAGRAYYKSLICILLARLIDDGLDELKPDLVALLKAKLARRLAKLEFDKSRASPDAAPAYENVLGTLGTPSRNIFKKANQSLERTWDEFKRTVRRPMPLLPRRADPRDFILSLPNSEAYLQQVLSWHRQSCAAPQSDLAGRLNVGVDLANATTKPFGLFAARYSSLTEMEAEIDGFCSMAPAATTDAVDYCLDIKTWIDRYLSIATPAYESSPEHKSMMLLRVMQLWMKLDRHVAQIVPLLLSYSPGISPEALDVLQLEHVAHIFRLETLQEYLRVRHRDCVFVRQTIFDDPGKNCFAQRYFDEWDESRALEELGRRIETKAEAARKRKEEEWRKQSAEFEELEKAVGSLSCVFTTDENLMVHHNDEGCNKCFVQRKARRMRIGIHEHPLPSDPIHVKAVLFELDCPKAFVAYRDATWKILGSLARSEQIASRPPYLTLHDYGELTAFSRGGKIGTVTLASTTKPFLSTHYNSVSFPVNLEKVCLPNGLKLGYFDISTGMWPGRQASRPNFAHHCPIVIPSKSPFNSLQNSPTLAAESNGPTSYQIVASQTRCPTGISVHEFTAFQTLFSGKRSRWLSILIELGSSNLNFSTEAVTSLIAQLVLQAGPCLEGDPFRMIHQTLRDVSFGKRLLEQIGRRMDNISGNWHETNCMEMLITLTLRLCSIAPEPINSEALGLLETARKITGGWMRHLRDEIYRSTDAEASKRFSRHAFLGAMLCRRTFAVYAEHADSVTLYPEALRRFIECSVTLQDNVGGDPAVLPTSVRNALIRDLQMVHRMRFALRRSVDASIESVGAALNDVWQQPGGEFSRSRMAVRFLDGPNKWWIECTVAATHQSRKQKIHYHILGGHLLVDGQPLGKLPAEHRGSVTVKQLFGQQNLLTYPSALRGMAYTLPFAINKHRIHMGFRNGSLFVQAYVRDVVLEFIPSEVFGGVSNRDLPGSLVHSCVHWLNLRTGVLEVRQRPSIWKSKPGNWLVDLNTHTAHRRTSTLVNPHSALFQRITRIFDDFEHREHLTVFQPLSRPLSLELRRLELTFSVNQRGLLHCHQLRAEVDSDQDPGVFYGLRSMLVLRDVLDRTQRSIIVPIGEAKCVQNRFHVSVRIENHSSYGRFAVDEVLGRLDCPIEPRLLYLKAQLHAYTSFIVPDPLTRRTGTEEALRCLSAGYCQPWTPLNSGPLAILRSIARLSAKREYYPKDGKAMQQVYWDANLTPTIQHDDFRPVVESICQKSNQLSLFTLTKADGSTASSIETFRGSQHLLNRGRIRRHTYERPNPEYRRLDAVPDTVYAARDRAEPGNACANATESVWLIRKQFSQMPTTSGLAAILQEWPTIGGYQGSFSKILLSDLLDINLALEWGSLVNLCRESGTADRHRLMFLFAIMSFRVDAEMDVIRVLIAFSILKDLKTLEPPMWPCYMQFRLNQPPTTDYLLQLMESCCVPYPGDERNIFHNSLSAKHRKKLEAAELAHEQQTTADCKALAEFLLEQWPCDEPQMAGFSRAVLLNIPKALEIIRVEWLRLYQNYELSQHIQEVQTVLDVYSADIREGPPRFLSCAEKVLSVRRREGQVPTLLNDLLLKENPSKSLADFPTLQPTVVGGRTDKAYANKMKENVRGAAPNVPLLKKKPQSGSEDVRELESIIAGIADSPSALQKQYAQDLMHSINALKALKEIPKVEERPILPAEIDKEIFKARDAVRTCFRHLCEAFERNDSRAPWLKEGGLWPYLTPVTLLEQLRSTSTSKFGTGMKEGLVAYGVAITSLQRLLRIKSAIQKKDHQRLLDEQKNKGHTNWQPLQYPDWLLLEVDGDIMIRPDQVEVALATITPASGSNSVLQMNMGQGKTSCIMPMVATSLADTEKLLRVVVPKALLLQTAQILQARLGGLLGRDVNHIPFSRKTPTETEVIKTFFDIHKEAKASSGVVVALPEHILSFMLGGVQRLSDNRVREATQMVKVQGWLRRVCRDVLDECDFTLAVRTQLIYPSGSQTAVDGHPRRWETIETLLHLVKGHLWNLQREFLRSIDVVERTDGGFPMVYFLRQDAEDALIARLVDDIVGGRTPIVPTRECSKPDRQTIRRFISEAVTHPGITDRIDSMFPDKPVVKKTLYLVRGLFVHRILLLTLKKRWNVQYGLHPERDPIAVPFHAKGVPSDQAEWGHPDVAILLTCLAFYFGGLNLAQLRQSLEHLIKSDDPSSEYDRWTHVSGNMPDSLRDWNIINVNDEQQLLEIWKHVRHRIVVIDYFLNTFVFPGHAKQFQRKLQASGWDIPLFLPKDQLSDGKATSAAYPKPLTTGFSGTNDNRALLPLTIRQEDLRRLSHTNAEVLTYLLQPRNRGYVLAADRSGKRLSELSLLRTLHRKGIRMLIDAGAQILEMDNHSLVRKWLSVDHTAAAAVYFNAENKPVALYQDGFEIPLVASPFSDNLTDCLVYLDEAHTRGTDLKMPANARGALTLGLGQTKDNTVQAAMRLRQLATSQSIVFFAPPEVHQSIIDFRRKNHLDHIDSSDVVHWLLHQTCASIEQFQPLYFSQGIDFCRRTQAALDNQDFLSEEDQRGVYLRALRQTEHQTLEQLYKPRLKAKSAATSGPFCPPIAAFVKELNTRRKGFQDFGNAVHGSALQEVEQEREVAFEVESVREVQKPVRYAPLSFPGVHPDIFKFVKTGRLVAGYEGYEHALMAVRRTALGQKYGISGDAMMSRLFVSREFSRTVNTPPGRPNDNFLRPVNWILWSTLTETALVIIPEEAEVLLRLLRDSVDSRTHLLTFATPTTRRMLHFNDLTYYAVPALPRGWKAPIWLTIELGIFAGRLYFEFNEYDGLRNYLGLEQEISEPSETALIPGVSAAARGSESDAPMSLSIQDVGTGTGSGSRTGTGTRPTPVFTSTPLTFLQEWLAIRRKDQDFTHTPMGYVCQGKRLTADHHFFAKIDQNAATAAIVTIDQTRHFQANYDDDDDDDDDVDVDHDGGGVDDGVDVEGRSNAGSDQDEALSDMGFGVETRASASEEDEPERPKSAAEQPDLLL